MKKRSGITLTMLVIYMVILSIIMGAVVLNLGYNNQIEELDKSTYQAKILDYIEQFTTMKNYYTIKGEYNDEIMTRQNEQDIYGRTIADYIGSITMEDKEYLCIYNGELHTFGMDTEDTRYGYIQELGITQIEYIVIPKVYYAITYNANGGNGNMTRQTYEEGKSAILKENQYTKEGYIFKGWSTSANGNVEYNNRQTVNFEGNVTLYAIWSKLYTVQYYANTTSTVSNIPSTSQHELNENILISSTIPQRKGYEFKGWSTNSSSQSVEYLAGASIQITGNTTLYAIWNLVGYEYVKNGMIVYLDGEFNSEQGHNSTATMWHDISGNQNHGTLTNFNNTSTSGWGIDNLTFDGSNDYVKIENPNNIPTGSSAYTMEIVFKYNSSKSAQGLFNIGIFSTNGKANAFRTSGTGFRHYYWANDLDSASSILTNSNKYTAVALNYGSDRRIYLNGVLQVKDSATPSVTMGTVTVGVTSTSLSEYFASSIYCVRLYNRGLTESEINANYQIDKLRFNL